MAEVEANREPSRVLYTSDSDGSFLDITEIGCFEAEKNHEDQKEGSGNIPEAHLAVFGRSPEFQGQIRRQQVDDEPNRYGAHPIPNRLPG